MHNVTSEGLSPSSGLLLNCNMSRETQSSAVCLLNTIWVQLQTQEENKEQIMCEPEVLESSSLLAPRKYLLVYEERSNPYCFDHCGCGDASCLWCCRHFLRHPHCFCPSLLYGRYSTCSLSSSARGIASTISTLWRVSYLADLETVLDNPKTTHPQQD